jgi:hypothetical protein
MVGTVLLCALGLGFGWSTPRTWARTTPVPLESLMVSNLVRLSTGHPGQWQKKTLRRGVQVRVQRFASCDCDTALFTLHKRFGTLTGQVYVDNESNLSAGQVTVLTAGDFTKPDTYVRLWQQNQLSRVRPTKFQVHVTGVNYLLVRVAAPTCCLAIDVVANLNP